MLIFLASLFDLCVFVCDVVRANAGERIPRSSWALAWIFRERCQFIGIEIISDLKFVPYGVQNGFSMKPQRVGWRRRRKHMS